jgi:hypothetical protein
MTHRERQLSDFVNSSPDERERECADLPDRAIDRQLATHREAPSCNGSQQESQKLTGDAAGETPRTDAAEFDWSIIQGREYKTKRVVSAGFARQLERESSSLKAQLEGFRKAIRDFVPPLQIAASYAYDQESTAGLRVHAKDCLRQLEKHQAAIDSALQRG